MLLRMLMAYRARRGEAALPDSSVVQNAPTIEVRLVTTLHLVNTWLQHAEAKNAGLTAFTAVAATGILTFLASQPNTSLILTSGLLVTALLVIISLAISLISFLPRTDVAKLLSGDVGQPKQADNLYFFGDLQKYQPQELVEAVARQYDTIDAARASTHRSHIDLAGQIIANSRITVIKNDLFRTANLLTLLALICTVVSTVLTLVFCR